MALKDSHKSLTRVHDIGRLNTSCCFYHSRPVYSSITEREYMQSTVNMYFYSA